ncbi:response regulator [Aeromonas dhakensis]|uniref:response regulator n=1 Tax=Aeromonas dhakensis TaxID=196024 RepID=UPI0021B4958F|nr:response regulator [Aeromonas dhakensis]UXB14094.1 response regulator [Aeromonas dhakensis]
MVDLGNNAPVQATTPSITSLPTKIATRERYRILLVDDNATNRKVIGAILESVGHQVTVAFNGEDALVKFLDDKFDIVLMDIQMPVMNDFTATTNIRTSNECWENIPIVALTADAMPESKQFYMSHGMNGYITKPVSKVALIQEIKKVKLPITRSALNNKLQERNI